MRYEIGLLQQGFGQPLILYLKRVLRIMIFAVNQGVGEYDHLLRPL